MPESIFRKQFPNRILSILLYFSQSSILISIILDNSITSGRKTINFQLRQTCCRRIVVTVLEPITIYILTITGQPSQGITNIRFRYSISRTFTFKTSILIINKSCFIFGQCSFSQLTELIIYHSFFLSVGIFFIIDISSIIITKNFYADTRIVYFSLPTIFIIRETCRNIS